MSSTRSSQIAARLRVTTPVSLHLDLSFFTWHSISVCYGCGQCILKIVTYLARALFSIFKLLVWGSCILQPFIDALLLIVLNIQMTYSSNDLNTQIQLNPYFKTIFIYFFVICVDISK